MQVELTGSTFDAMWHSLDADGSGFVEVDELVACWDRWFSADAPRELFTRPEREQLLQRSKQFGAARLRWPRGSRGRAAWLIAVFVTPGRPGN